MLMLPVTIGLGLINFNVLINSSLGSLVSEEAARGDRSPPSASTCSPRASSAPADEHKA